jgi:hypothetical protein
MGATDIKMWKSTDGCDIRTLHWETFKRSKCTEFKLVLMIRLLPCLNVVYVTLYPQVIYDLIDDVKAAMEGKLRSIEEKVPLGKAEVKAIFGSGEYPG